MTDKPMRPRPRRLNVAERTLWAEVTREIRPLRPEPAADTASDSVDIPAEQAAARSADRHSAVGVSPPPETRGPPPLAPLGRRMRQRIARGTHEIAGRIDLHGMTQREAHDALLGFLRTAQGRNAGVVLVITGKGAPGERSGSERGVLRRQVPHWLGLPGFRELIVGFEPAHRTHGGEGALYVRIRRRRG